MLCVFLSFLSYTLPHLHADCCLLDHWLFSVSEVHKAFVYLHLFLPDEAARKGRAGLTKFNCFLDVIQLQESFTLCLFNILCIEFEASDKPTQGAISLHF